jgi:outer membrane protein OmpA-like peptidoglycan-associated protein
MRHRLLRITTVGGMVLILGSSGCASRGFVRRQLSDLRTELYASNDTLQSHLRVVQGKAGDAESMATTAIRDLRSTQDLALGRVGYREVNRSSVHFALGSAEPETGSEAVLEQVADQINREPHLLIELYGFTDPTGSTAYNLELGRRRAEAVMRDLTNGSPGQLNRFQLISYGESLPAQEASSLSDAAQRRQVEIVLVEKIAPEKANAPVASRESRP